MGMIEKYLKDDRTHERVAGAILAFRQQQYWEDDGKSAELAVFILNSLLDELAEIPEGPFDGASWWTEPGVRATEVRDDWIPSPELVAVIRAAEADLAAGRLVSLDEVLDEWGGANHAAEDELAARENTPSKADIEDAARSTSGGIKSQNVEPEYEDDE